MFDDKLAQQRLSEVMKDINPRLLAHPRFYESFIQGCFGSIKTSNPNSYNISISEDGMSIMINGGGKYSNGAPYDKNNQSNQDYAYLTTISLYGTENDMLKVSIDEGCLDSSEYLRSVGVKLNTSARWLLTTKNRTSFYDNLGLELARKSLTDRRIPLSGHVIDITQQLKNYHYVLCDISGAPTKKFTNDAEVTELVRDNKNPGLIYFSESEVKPMQDVCWHTYIEKANAFPHPQNISINVRRNTALSHGTVISTNPQYNGMLLSQYSNAVKESYNSELETLINHPSKSIFPYVANLTNVLYEKTASVKEGMTL